ETSSTVFVPLQTGDDVAQRREQVLSQYAAYKSALLAKRVELNEALRFQHFLRDTGELERWMADRMQIALDESWKDTTNLEIRLQKHTTLEAEVNANKGSLDKLDNEGQDMVKNNYSSSDVIEARLIELHLQWEALLKALELRGVKLRQTFLLIDFQRKCDEVLYWIRDKEIVVTSTDSGNDLEHVNMLVAKFEEFQSELQGYSDRVKDVNDGADRLIAIEEHPEVDVITNKKEAVNNAWTSLNQRAQQRNRHLLATTEVFKFKRDVNESISWMKEKESLLESNDLGTDVSSVQALQRRHEGIERDLAALEEKVSELLSEADRIERDHGTMQEINEQRDVINGNWERVTRVAAERKIRLKQSYELQKFLAESRELLSWCDDIESRITADELAHDVSGAEALVDKHQEHRKSAVAQEEKIGSVNDVANRLIERGHYAQDEIGKRRD
uniref:Uncharacterized protein n=1 Tax=Ciona savignyi TaxID=51511 RepID=H2Y4N3_CIOSA